MWLRADPENVKVCYAVIEQNRVRRQELQNSSGKSKGNPKDLRLGLSLPPGLYYILKNLEKFHGREFMRDKKDLYWFARKFPQFTISERI